MLWVLIRITTLAILMSTHNICFYGELTKIILQLSSNTLLTSSVIDRIAYFSCSSDMIAFIYSVLRIQILSGLLLR